MAGGLFVSRPPTRHTGSAANRTRLLSLTAPVTLAGLPALTLPAPLADGLTTALQIVAPAPASPVLPVALAEWT